MRKFLKWIRHGRKGRISLNEIPGYADIDEGFYIEDGHLYGLSGKRIKGSWSRSKQYPYNSVTLKDVNGDKTHKRLDRIIAAACVDGRTEKRNEVDHVNGVHNDDRPENLRWLP